MSVEPLKLELEGRGPAVILRLGAMPPPLYFGLIVSHCICVKYICSELLCTWFLCSNNLTTDNLKSGVLFRSTTTNDLFLFCLLLYPIIIRYPHPRSTYDEVWNSRWLLFCSFAISYRSVLVDVSIFIVKSHRRWIALRSSSQQEVHQRRISTRDDLHL